MSGHFTKTQLVENGWTDSLIRRFLPEPDRTKPNPRYKSAAPMLLYAEDRVARVEATDAFKAEEEKVARRRRTSELVVASKRARTAEHVEGLTYKVPVIERGELISRACKHFNGRARNWDDPATADSDPFFLERITVNYLRHRLTNYDDHLDEVAGKVGCDDARSAIKRKVLAAIREGYPWLARECERQRGGCWL
jgi:hypothetical protein